jgi:putative NIF3 family GTP cyclohydrolase 1 type 2
MASLVDILADLDELLEPERFDDYCPNGLQVAGRPAIGTVATGVSANLELFDAALARGADLVLTHHGILWKGDDPRVVAARSVSTAAGRSAAAASSRATASPPTS